MGWLSDLWGGTKNTVGDAWEGVSGTATDLANSEAAGKLIDYFTSDSDEEKKNGQQQNSKIPSWVLPVGIGAAVLLFVALIMSIIPRRR